MEIKWMNGNKVNGWTGSTLINLYGTHCETNVIFTIKHENMKLNEQYHEN